MIRYLYVRRLDSPDLDPSEDASVLDPNAIICMVLNTTIGEIWENSADLRATLIYTMREYAGLDQQRLPDSYTKIDKDVTIKRIPK